MTKYLSPLVLVETFHLTYGQVVRITPRLNVPERLLRVALIDEEVKELKEAIENNDFIEVVDALADILYVVYGAAITHGIHLDYVMGNLNNESPAEVVEQIRKDGFVGHIKSTPHFNKEALDNAAEKLTALLGQLVLAGETENVDLFTDTLVNLVVTAYIASALCSVDIDMVLEEVQASNLSKLGEDGLPIVRADGKILKGPGFFTPNIAGVLASQGWES